MTAVRRPGTKSKPISPDQLPFLSLDRIWDALRAPDAAGSGLLVPPPPIYTELLERARAAGFRVRNLYMLRRHVAMSRAACYDAVTGDIWIQSGTENNLYYLLHELAHAAQSPKRIQYQVPPVTTHRLRRGRRCRPGHP